MGITGLLPFLKKCSKESNIKDFSGCTVAIDAYCWLHKGAFSCAEKLVMNEPTTMYVVYCMKYVNMLLSHNIKPILVFDGQNLPAKALTETKRRQNRDINRRKGLDMIRAGQVAEGRNVLRRSLDVTHEMALEVMKECHRRNVDCIVAPYEADAQLAYLNLQGIAHVIITEDSDLMLFGCKTVMFKMDINGNGIVVESNKLHLAMGINAENYSLEKFRLMCILSGCDYLESLQGIGLSKACKFVTRTTETDIYKALGKLAANLNMWKLEVTDEYREAVVAADLTFRCQLVFDPRKRQQVPLTEPRENEQPIGEKKDDDVAFQLALGNVHPRTLKSIHSFDPDTYFKKTMSRSDQAMRSSHPSIWSAGFNRPFLKQKVVPSILRHATVGKVVKAEVPIYRAFENEEPVNDGIDLLKLYGGIKRRRESLENEQLQSSRYFGGDGETCVNTDEKEQSCLDQIDDLNDEKVAKIELDISHEDTDLFTDSEQYSNTSLSSSFVGKTELLSMGESTESEISSTQSSLTQTESLSSSNEINSISNNKTENENIPPSSSPELKIKSPLQAFKFKEHSNSPRTSALKAFDTVGTSKSVFFGGSTNTPLQKVPQGKLRMGLTRRKPLPPQQSVLSKFGFQVRPKLT